MLSVRLTTLTLAMIASLAASTARAADIPLPPPPVIEEFSSWYLRGYLGMSNQSAQLYHPSYDTISTLQKLDRGFDSAPIFGLGVGYNFNDWLRFDVTGEYRGSANFHGLDWYGGGVPAPGGGSDEYHARKYEWLLLANAYADLGTWYSITPFVGVGVGGAYNTIANFVDINTPNGGVYHAEDHGKFNFAWALHAGLAYKVTRNFTVELAYRYLDLGKAETGTGVSFDGTNANGRPFQFNYLHSHDLMLGLRFNLDALSEARRPAQYYMPPPPPLRSRG